MAGNRGKMRCGGGVAFFLKEKHKLLAGGEIHGKLGSIAACCKGYIAASHIPFFRKAGLVYFYANIRFGVFAVEIHHDEHNAVAAHKSLKSDIRAGNINIGVFVKQLYKAFARRTVNGAGKALSIV